MQDVEDDLIPLLDELPEAVAAAGSGGMHEWPILVIDDDPEVHSATRFALAGVDILGRALQLDYASSSAEARQMLQLRQDYAVILLDVVMETEDAGLQLVGFIRETLGMQEVRIILRTGQPGYAPELAVFTNYDINDYRTKAELSRTRLVTSLTAALRSFQQLRTIAEGRRGLEMIIRAAARLMQHQALSEFAEGVLIQVAAMLRLSPEGIVCAQRGSLVESGDSEGLYVVGAAGQLASYIGHPLADLPDSADAVSAIAECMQARCNTFGKQSTVIYLSSGGRDGAVYMNTGFALSDMDQQLIGVFGSNMSACFGNVRLLEDLNYTAYHDGLTHLPNRTRFIMDLDEVANADQLDINVVLLDIEHFADLNDGLGHEVGNALLIAVANRLKDELGQHCQLARIGADVFGIIGPEAHANPEHMQELLKEPFAVEDHLLPVSFSMGVCRLLERTPSGVTLLKRANIALNRAKHSLHSSFEYFLPEMEDGTRWRLDTIRQLRQDFLAGRLALWFQPQIELASGRLIGIEALLRWPGTDGFVQPPQVFIPLAEYSGLIVDIGLWVLDQACASFKQLSVMPNAPRYVAVNVSMPQLRGGRFPGQVAEVLARHGLPADTLELEVTESLAMDQPKIVVGSLEALRAVGARIAIDDFGTGYSSLGHLRQLPINCLKIDQSFIREIEDGKGGMFAETIVALSQKLGVSTIAEGVETIEQASFLRGLGCTTAQGYLFGKPMPLNQLIEWMAHQPK